MSNKQTKGRRLTDRDREILLAYAECNMNCNAVAEILIMHRNTVQYHLDKIQRVTGLNPNSFYDLVERILGVRKQQEEAETTSVYMSTESKYL